MLVKPLPRPMIIEKWLRYKSSAEHPARPCPTESTPRETHFGCFRVDPEIYRSQYKCELRRKQCIGRVLANLGYDAALIASLGYGTSRASSHYDHLQTVRSARDQFVNGPSRPEPHYDTPRIHDDEPSYLSWQHDHRETLT